MKGEYAREMLNARRRTRFRYVDIGIPTYERPCGCRNGNYLPDGVRFFLHSSLSLAWNLNDLAECLQCGAAWRIDEVVPDRCGRHPTRTERPLVPYPATPKTGDRK